MPNPVVHFEILAKDGKAAQEFYTKLFGWTVDASNPMGYGMVNTGSEGASAAASPARKAALRSK